MRIQKGRYYKALVDVTALKDSMQDVTDELAMKAIIIPDEPLKPRCIDGNEFPSFDSFYDWWKEVETIKPHYVWEWFYNKGFVVREFPEEGECYEFSHNGSDWYKDSFVCFKGFFDDWKHIRVIQDPKQNAIDGLKAITEYSLSDREWEAVQYAIKALEEQ